jgi:hypothetical protein
VIADGRTGNHRTERMIRRIEITDLWIAVVEANYSVRLYTDEYVAGSGESFPVSGLPQGEIYHGLR